MRRNLRPMACGRAPYYVNQDMDVVMDEARSNRIVRNEFLGPARWGVIVEDDQTVLSNNLFIGPFSEGTMMIGTKYRNQVLGKPVLGTVLLENRFPSEQPPRWVYGSKP